MRILVVGGGAAGFFAAITCAEAAPGSRVTICEATAHVLAKVRVSGGGRCNVTHACFDPAVLVKNYPRGARELLGPMHRWQPRDTVEWFESRGVKLKTEADGRMFPVTDDSATIVDCLQRAAADARVEVRLGAGVTTLERIDGAGFRAVLGDGSALEADRVLLATGGNKSSAGLKIARALGHVIETPVPSLFTFHSSDARIQGLAGVSVPDVEATVPEFRLAARGALLVTHWGLSGPAVLKLSAWGARPFAACDYRFRVKVNFLPATAGPAVDAAARLIAAGRVDQARKQVVSWCPLPIPARLWERLVAAAGVREDRRWAAVSNEEAAALASQLAAAEFAVAGKSMNKEEFVTCGGVSLAQVDFRTMESRLAPGLFFAGEVLDIDGVTGGFNFQAAWTTGRIAGEAMASRASRATPAP